jgi:hypothetical protein
MHYELIGGSGLPWQWYILCSPCGRVLSVLCSSSHWFGREDCKFYVLVCFHHVLRLSSPRLPYVLPAPPTVHGRCPSSFLLPHSLSILRLLADFLISNSGRMSFHDSEWSISGSWMIPVGSQTTGHLDWYTSWTPVLLPLHLLPSYMAGVNSRPR